MPYVRMWLLLLHPSFPLHTHTETVDSNVRTPLHHAAESGNIAIVIALVEEGRADINKASGGRGDTPLITSARQGHSQQARYLLSHGADVTAVNEDGTYVCTYVCHFLPYACNVHVITEECAVSPVARRHSTVGSCNHQHGLSTEGGMD